MSLISRFLRRMTTLRWSIGLSVWFLLGGSSIAAAPCCLPIRKGGGADARPAGVATSVASLRRTRGSENIAYQAERSIAFFNGQIAKHAISHRSLLKNGDWLRPACKNLGQ